MKTFRSAVIETSLWIIEVVGTVLCRCTRLFDFHRTVVYPVDSFDQPVHKSITYSYTYGIIYLVLVRVHSRSHANGEYTRRSSANNGNYCWLLFYTSIRAWYKYVPSVISSYRVQAKFLVWAHQGHSFGLAMILSLGNGSNWHAVSLQVVA